MFPRDDDVAHIFHYKVFFGVRLVQKEGSDELMEEEAPFLLGFRGSVNDLESVLEEDRLRLVNTIKSP